MKPWKAYDPTGNIEGHTCKLIGDECEQYLVHGSQNAETHQVSEIVAQLFDHNFTSLLSPERLKLGLDN